MKSLQKQFFLLTLCLTLALSAQFRIQFYEVLGCSKSGARPTADGVVDDSGTCQRIDNSNANRYAKIEPYAEGYTVTIYRYNSCLFKLASQKIEDFELNQCVDFENFLGLEKGSVQVSRAFACFPRDGTVEKMGGDIIRMDELKVGDVVRTTEGWSEVYAFLDKRSDIIGTYEEISFWDKNDELRKVRMTGEHLILAKRGNSEAMYVLAEEVQVGDYIYQQIGEMRHPVLVAEKKKVSGEGFFAPATLDGTIVVDGIAASSYAIVDHSVCHAVLAPLRFAYQLSPSLVPDQEYGIHPYAQYFYNTFSSWLSDKNAFYSCPALTSTSQ